MPMHFDENGNEIGEFPDDLNPGDFRAQIEEQNKRLKDAEKARLKAEQALAPFLAQQRESAVRESVGVYGDQAVKIWMRVNPDAEPTPDAVQAFAEEFDFAAPQAQAAPPQQQAAQPTGGYSPLPAGQPTGFQPQPMSKAEIDQLMRSDPEAGKRAIAEGRYQLRHPESQALLRR